LACGQPHYITTRRGARKGHSHGYQANPIQYHQPRVHHHHGGRKSGCAALTGYRQRRFRWCRHAYRQRGAQVRRGQVRPGGARRPPGRNQRGARRYGIILP